jgi:hypothetical protein
MSGGDTTLSVAPKPPAPLYPDVPWWAVLITAFVFALVGVLAGVYGSRPGAPALPGVGSAGSGILGRLAVDTVSYIPHILLLFGVLADMFTLDGAWSIPSLIGILSIFANYVFQYFWKGLDELVKTGMNAVKKGNQAPPDAPAAPAANPSRGVLDVVVVHRPVTVLSVNLVLVPASVGRHQPARGAVEKFAVLVP